MDQIKDIGHLVRFIENHYSNPKALNLEVDGKWVYMSTKMYISRVKSLALGLVKLGLKKGDKVAILAESSPNWSIADLAIAIAGGVSVPIFESISDSNFVFQITESEAKVLFLGGHRERQLYDSHKEMFTHVISIDGTTAGAEITPFEEVCRFGDQLQKEQPDTYSELEEAIDPDDLVTIIYTSGSLGEPKGAMLTHENLMWLIQFPDFEWNDKSDVYLSVLPLAHVFARQLNYIMLAWGVPLYYLNNLQLILKTSQSIQPTLMIVVPRLLEKVYAGMVTQIEKAQVMKRFIGRWAFDLAMQAEDSLCKYLLSPIADKMVYSHLREALGGKFRVMLCGGAALSPHLQNFYLEIGIPIYEGWGLTEASTVTVNLIGRRKVGTVGPVLPGSEIKIADDKEILIRGPTIMKGYYKNPQATAEVIDSEGWFHTGDQGSLDEDGFLKITGRIKELYKTSTGKYVSPIPIENALNESPLIDMSLVIAENRIFATALLFPDKSVLKQLKKAQEMEHLNDEEFLEHKDIQQEIQTLISGVNHELNSWEQIQNWRFVMETLTIKGGELTPTLRIKRDVVQKKYVDIIESMYMRGTA